MARNPDAEWLGEHADTVNLISRYDVLCVHTIVGYAPAHAAHFSTRADGTLLQSRDTRFWSAANYQGNYRAITVENEDHGPAFDPWNTNDGHAVPAFTDAQCETLAKLCVWANRTHGIPLVLCPDSRPGMRGIGYHRQGVNGDFTRYAYPGRVPEGELWSTVLGKSCPGDRRIWQLINVIIPRAKALASGGEEVMALTGADADVILDRGRPRADAPSLLTSIGGIMVNWDSARIQAANQRNAIQATQSAHGQAIAQIKTMCEQLLALHGGADVTEALDQIKAASIAAMQDAAQASLAPLLARLDELEASLNADDKEQAIQGAREALRGLRDALPAE